MLYDLNYDLSTVFPWGIGIHYPMASVLSNMTMEVENGTYQAADTLPVDKMIPIEISEKDSVNNSNMYWFDAQMKEVLRDIG